MGSISAGSEGRYDGFHRMTRLISTLLQPFKKEQPLRSFQSGGDNPFERRQVDTGMGKSTRRFSKPPEPRPVITPVPFRSPPRGWHI